MAAPQPQTFPDSYLYQARGLEEYAEKALLPADTRLESAVANSRANSIPDIAVTPLTGKYLALQCRLMNAKNVLEIGTLGGYSTIWFASSGAHVTSIELNPKHGDIALENTKGLDVEIILGAALDVLPKLAEQGRVFDFVFIDAMWEEQYQYFDWAVKMTRENGCIFVDNVVRELLESDVVGGQHESLVSQVGRDDRVDATLMGTINGRKPADEIYDGFLLAIVKKK